MRNSGFKRLNVVAFEEGDLLFQKELKEYQEISTRCMKSLICLICTIWLTSVWSQEVSIGLRLEGNCLRNLEKSRTIYSGTKLNREN